MPAPADLPADLPDSPGPGPGPGPGPELTAERGHLVASRAALARLRERTSSLDSAAAGDRVSQEILESALAQRLRALADDPAVPLFFGRLDLTGAAGAPGERLYVGRRHVTDEVGDPMVIDWRARVSRAFYRASRTEPMGVRRRRRFGYAGVTLTAFEDEDEDLRAVAPPDGADDADDAGEVSATRGPRSSGRAPGRCATSWPPSSPSRT